MTEYLNYQSEKVVDLGSKKAPPGKVPILISMIVFLATCALIAFGIGWFFGQSSANAQPEEDSNNISTTSVKAPDGKDVYLDPDEGYQVTYPKDWSAEGKNGDVKGVIVKKDDSSVDIYLSEKKVELSKAEKDKLEKTNKIELTVDGKKVEATEYIFKDDTYLTTGIIAATDKSPQVSFIIKASDEVAYPQSKEIVASIHFL